MTTSTDIVLRTRLLLESLLTPSIEIVDRKVGVLVGVLEDISKLDTPRDLGIEYYSIR